MAKAETTSSRAPRGSKIVMQAFFSALDAVPKMQQAAVSKAALTMIRDESKTRRAKAVTTAAKERARAPAKAAAPRKAPARTPQRTARKGAETPMPRGRRKAAAEPTA